MVENVDGFIPTYLMPKFEHGLLLQLHQPMQAYAKLSSPNVWTLQLDLLESGNKKWSYPSVKLMQPSCSGPWQLIMDVLGLFTSNIVSNNSTLYGYEYRKQNVIFLKNSTQGDQIVSISHC